MSGTRIVRVSDDQDVSAAATGAEAVRDGMLVGFATETVYGVAALATNEQAMRRLRKLKSRPRRPFTVHVGHPADVGRYVADLPLPGRKLIDRTWPGPVTLLLPVGRKLADAKLNKAGMRKVLCSKGMIGLRCPAAPLARAMLAAVDGPVVAPSANLVGSPSPRSGEEVLATLNGKIDLLIDSGPTRHGKDSTIVRIEGEDWKIVREGVVDAATLAEIMTRRIVFVCTGNTCRSPMAAGLATVYLAERLKCAGDEVAGRGWQISSAGVAAGYGAPTTAEALHAAKVLGANIARHRSRRVTKELINDADVVFCMTQRHVADVCRLVPAAAAKARRLDPDGDIPDPIGCGPDVYSRTAERLRDAVWTALTESLK